MRNPLALLLTAALLATAPAQAAAPKLDGEAKLAKALEGRVAGDPVRCIDLNRIRSSRIYEGQAIVYDAGSTLYVNRPRSGADSLDQWDTLVTRLHSNRLCSIDTVQLYDTSSRMLTGIVFLGDFVPYRKAPAARVD